MLFKDLQLSPALLQALSLKGYTHPTPIQQQAIPLVLAGRDVLATAQTGTGKTAAFTLPMLDLLGRQGKKTMARRAPRALVLTPTRELALQIAENAAQYKQFMTLSCTVLFGGVSQHHQVRELQAGTDIMIATPGRLKDLINQGLIDLKEIQFFVLDEADRMLDSGFMPDIRWIINRLPAKKQTLLFSATLPPDILQLSAKLLHEPARIAVAPVSSTAAAITQRVFHVSKEDKLQLLVRLLQNEEMDSVLVFTSMKHQADRISKNLCRSGIPAAAIHGNKSQSQRQHTLTRFKTRDVRVLVATDIVARGIDIDELSHVVNYELPDVPETYVHRIGRTGRKGRSGTAISFCSADQRDHLKSIQKLIAQPIAVGSAFNDHPNTLN